MEEGRPRRSERANDRGPERANDRSDRDSRGGGGGGGGGLMSDYFYPQIPALSVRVDLAAGINTQELQGANKKRYEALNTAVSWEAAGNHGAHSSVQSTQALMSNLMRQGSDGFDDIYEDDVMGGADGYESLFHQQMMGGRRGFQTEERPPNIILLNFSIVYDQPIEKGHILNVVIFFPSGEQKAAAMKVEPDSDPKGLRVYTGEFKCTEAEYVRLGTAFSYFYVLFHPPDNKAYSIEHLHVPHNRRTWQPRQFNLLRQIIREKEQSNHPRYHESETVLSAWRYDGLVMLDERRVDTASELTAFTAHVFSLLRAYGKNRNSFTFHGFRHLLAQVVRDFSESRTFSISPPEFSPQDVLYGQLVSIARSLVSQSKAPTHIRALLVFEAALFAEGFLQREGYQRAKDLISNILEASQAIALDTYKLGAGWDKQTSFKLATYAIQNGAIAEIRDTTDAPARLGDAGDVHPGNLELAPTERRPLIASMLDLANASMMSLVRKITKLEPNWFQGLFLVHLFAYLNHDTHFYENVRFMLNVDEDNSGATFVNGDRFNAFLNVVLLKSNLLALFVRTAQLSMLLAVRTEIQKNNPTSDIVTDVPLNDLLFCLGMNLREDPRANYNSATKVIKHVDAFRGLNYVSLREEDVVALQSIMAVIVQLPHLKSLTPNLDLVQAILMIILHSKEEAGRVHQRNANAMRACLSILHDWFSSAIVQPMIGNLDDMARMESVLFLADKLCNIHQAPAYIRDNAWWVNSFRSSLNEILVEIRDADLLESWIPNLLNEQLTYCVAEQLLEKVRQAHQRLLDGNALAQYVDRLLSSTESQVVALRRTRAIAYWFVKFAEDRLYNIEQSVVEWPYWTRMISLFSRFINTATTQAALVATDTSTQRASGLVQRALNHLERLKIELTTGEIDRPQLRHLEDNLQQSRLMLEEQGRIAKGTLALRFAAVRTVDLFHRRLQWLHTVLKEQASSLLEHNFTLDGNVRLKDALKDAAQQTLPLNRLVNMSTNVPNGETIPLLPLLTQEHLDGLARFNEAMQSLLFRSYAWNTTVQVSQKILQSAQQGQVLSLSQVHAELIQPALNKWSNLYNRLTLEPEDKTGLSLKECGEIFGSPTATQNLTKDLEILSRTGSGQKLLPKVNQQWVDQRQRVVKLFLDLPRIARNAFAVQESAKSLKLALQPKGMMDYLTSFQTYSSDKYQQRLLAEWSHEALDKLVSELLQSLSEHQYFCFAALPKMESFVSWLQSTTYTDDNQFNQIYSILSQTVEGDLDLDRVDAFRIVRDQVVSMLRLPQQCDTVDLIKAVQSTRATLSIEKLVSMNDEVEWLRGLKDRVESSEEENSFTQITKLLTRFNFQVGLPEGVFNTKENAKAHAETAEELGELFNIVRMVVHDEHRSRNEAENVREIDKLDDLRSRLMLVMGDTDETDHIDQLRRQAFVDAALFSKLLDGAINLGKAILDLRSAGHSGTETQIAAYPSSVEGLKEMQKRTVFVEATLKAWVEHVEKARGNLPVLNYFTLQQLTTIEDLLHDLSTTGAAAANAAFKVQKLKSLLYVLAPSIASTPEAHTVQVYASIRSTYQASSYLEIVGYFLNQLIADSGLNQDLLAVEEDGMLIDGADGGNEPMLDQLASLRSATRSHYTVVVQRQWFPSLVAYARQKGVKLPWEVSKILFCTPETTAEEVDLFCRRMLKTLAFEKTSRTPFCICVPSKSHLSRRLQEKMLRLLLSEEAGAAKPQLVVLCGEAIDLSDILLSSGAVQPLVQIPDDSLLQAYVKNALWISGLNLPQVLVVSSDASGSGKTHTIQTIVQSKGLEQHDIALYESSTLDEVVHLLRDRVPYNGVLGPALRLSLNPIGRNTLMDELVFKMLFVGSIADSEGNVWHRVPSVASFFVEAGAMEKFSTLTRHIINVMPMTVCPTPLQLVENKELRCDVPVPFLAIFETQSFQRVAYHLKHEPKEEAVGIHVFDPALDKMPALDAVKAIMKAFDPTEDFEKDKKMGNPPLRLLAYLVKFLDQQFIKIETHPMIVAMQQDDPRWQGMVRFVFRTVLETSTDLASPSLSMFTQRLQASDADADAMDVDNAASQHDLLAAMQFRRSWATSNHHFLLTKHDQTFVFFGFNITRLGRTKDNFRRKILSEKLFKVLEAHNVQLLPDPKETEDKRRERFLETICFACRPGMPAFDPDRTYVLTEDNVRKILSIYFRFESGIPVIVIGETGCGKTRLVTFMAGLLSGQAISGTNAPNMVLLKVHGGTTLDDIRNAVKRAVEKTKGGLNSILFLDECNTSEHMAFIKELVCDRYIDGKPLNNDLVHMIAVCNPYRKHSDVVIRKLAEAGLGYRASDQSTEKMGNIPLRHLVYRVQPLPPAMAEVAWDFGALEQESEKRYISSLVNSHLSVIPGIENQKAAQTAVSKLLELAQNFMRNQPDECSFVSLRDIERALELFDFFFRFRHVFDGQGVETEATASPSKLRRQGSGISTLKKANETKEEMEARMLERTLTLMIAVCYQNKLSDETKRQQFRREVAPVAVPRLASRVQDACDQFVGFVVDAQELIMDNVKLPVGIARNVALSDNLFMMFVCIQLAIPLVLVGKPGSSKSLAKQLLQSAMLGGRSPDAFFKNFREIQLFSYQCSPLSVSDGIIETFQRGKRLQDKKNGYTDAAIKSGPVPTDAAFVSVVVLDEVGLAEDSPRMPLKVLHALLEERQVPFVGISNWALDPAKMNRAIQITRTSPAGDELVNTARGICLAGKDNQLHQSIEALLQPLADAYRAVSENTSSEDSSDRPRDFYGLRDFYFLVKTILQLTQDSPDGRLTSEQLEAAIRRNFGGVPQLDSVIERFFVEAKLERPTSSTSQLALIDDCLKRQARQEIRAFADVRYLLVLTQQQSAFSILFTRGLLDQKQTEIFVGSAFPRDQSYAQICRKINRIKVCMETGRTVLLLNMESLYESLYDLLNGSYSFAGEQRYVDLGLGSHRVKCRVHPNFRLLIVAEQEKVYREYAIPLINRLEKHILSTANLLRDQSDASVDSDLANAVKDSMDKWIGQIVPRGGGVRKDIRGAIFAGYTVTNTNLLPSLVWQLALNRSADEESIVAQLQTEATKALLTIATPEGVLLASKNALPGSRETLRAFQSTYLQHYAHDRLRDFLRKHFEVSPSSDTIEAKGSTRMVLMTHSRPPTTDQLVQEIQAVSYNTEAPTLFAAPGDLGILNLQHYESEEQLVEDVQLFSSGKKTLAEGGSLSAERLLVIVSPDSHRHVNMLTCAKLNIQNQSRSVASNSRVHIIILAALDRTSAPAVEVSFDGIWTPAYIDTLLTHPYLPNLAQLFLVHEAGAAPGVAIPVSNILLDGTLFNFQLSRLLPLCVQNCMALLDYPMQLLNTGTAHRWENLRDRVHLIGNILSDSQKLPQVTHAIQRAVVDLLKQRDDPSVSAMIINEWAVRVAGSSDIMTEAGTFHQALWLRVLEHITMALAQVVSNLDAGGNLGVLVQALRSNVTGAERLWSSICVNGQLFKLSYKPSTYTRFPVLPLGSSQSTTWFPFSNVVYPLLERFLANERLVQQGNNVQRLHASLAHQLSTSVYKVHLVQQQQQEKMDTGKGDDDETGSIAAGGVVISDEPGLVKQYLHDFLCLHQSSLLDNLPVADHASVIDLYFGVYQRRLGVLLKALGLQEDARALHLSDVHLLYADVERTLFALYRCMASGVTTTSDLLAIVVRRTPSAPAEPVHWSAQLVTHVLEQLKARVMPPESTHAHLETVHLLDEMRTTTDVTRTLQLHLKQLFDDFGSQWSKQMVEDTSSLWRRVAVSTQFYDDVALPSFIFTRPTSAEVIFSYLALKHISTGRYTITPEDSVNGLRNFLREFSTSKAFMARHGLTHAPLCFFTRAIPENVVEGECGHVFEAEALRLALVHGTAHALTCPDCKATWTRPAEARPEAVARVNAYRADAQRISSFFLEMLPMFLLQAPSFEMPLSPSVISGPFRLPSTKLISLLLSKAPEDSHVLGRFEEQSFVLMMLLRIDPAVLCLGDGSSNATTAGSSPSASAASAATKSSLQASLNDLHKQPAFAKLLESCVYDLLQQGLPSQVQCRHPVGSAAYLGWIISHDITRAIEPIARARVKYALTQAASRWIETSDNSYVELMKTSTDVRHNVNFGTDAQPFLLRSIWNEGGVRVVERFVAECVGSMAWLQDYQVPSDERSDAFSVATSAFPPIRTYTTVQLSNYKLLPHTRETLNEDIVKSLISPDWRTRLAVALSLARLVFIDRTPETQIAADTINANLAQKLPVLSQPDNVFGNLVMHVLSNAAHEQLKAAPIPAGFDRSSLAGLITHASFVSSMFEGNHLVAQLHPLFVQVETPGIAGLSAQVFVPTMPEDLIAALLRGTLFNELAGSSHRVVYMCQCGYPYMIGDCGRPNAVGNCPVCKVKIGGTSHKLVETSSERRPDADTTKPGYILDENYLELGLPERTRDLSPLEVVINRALVHLWIVAGTWFGPNNSNNADMRKKFTDRLVKDILTMSKELGKSREDVVLLLHVLISRMCTYEVPANESVLLTTKLGRNKWETLWQRELLAPLLKNLSGELDAANKLAMDWRAAGNNQFLSSRITTKTQHDLGRPKAGNKLQQFKQIFQANFASSAAASTADDAPHAILSHYLANSEVLANVYRYLPALLRLIKAAHEKFTIKADARLGELRETAAEGHRFLVEHVQQFRMLRNQNASPMEAMQTAGLFSDALPLAELLSSVKPAGKMLKTVLREIINIHNDFVARLSRLRRVQLQEQLKTTSLLQDNAWKALDAEQLLNHTTLSYEVSLLRFRPDNLVSATAEADLLPLIFLHSIEKGKGEGAEELVTVAQFDFKRIEASIVSRFLSNRPSISVKSIGELFAEESAARAYASNLQALAEWSEPVSFATLQKILEEIQREQLLSVSVRRLAANARFLITGGLPKDQSIEWFEDQVLVLPPNERLPSETARKELKIHHVSTLWQFLDIQRLALLQQRDESGLEFVPPEFCVDLPEAVEPEVKRRMQAIDIYRVLVDLHRLLNDKIANAGESETQELDVNVLLSQWVESLQILGDLAQMQHIVAVFRVACGVLMRNAQASD